MDSDDEGEVPPLLGIESRPAAGAAKAVVMPSTAKETTAPRTARPPKPQSGGMKKGFLSGGSKPARRADAPKGPAGAVPFVAPKKESAKSALELPEVQQEMAASEAAAAGLGGGKDGWVTPDLLSKIGADPVLRKAFTDPQYAEVMAALQTDPAGAIKKYGHKEELAVFLRKFMALMGDHFTALADANDAQAGPGAGGSGMAARGAPAVEPKPESAAERSAREAAERAMSDPEIAAILREPAVQAVLDKLQQGRAVEVEAQMRSPEMMAKLRRLAQAGLIGMEMR